MFEIHPGIMSKREVLDEESRHLSKIADFVQSKFQTLQIQMFGIHLFGRDPWIQNRPKLCLNESRKCVPVIFS